MNVKAWLVGGGISGAVVTLSLVGRMALPVLAQGPAATPQDTADTPSYTS